MGAQKERHEKNLIQISDRLLRSPRRRAAEQSAPGTETVTHARLFEHFDVLLLLLLVKVMVVMMMDCVVVHHHAVGGCWRGCGVVVVVVRFVDI